MRIALTCLALAAAAVVGCQQVPSAPPDASPAAAAPSPAPVPVPASRPSTAPVPTDARPSPLNAPGYQYPMVDSTGRAYFRISAPNAQGVVIGIGRRFPLT